MTAPPPATAVPSALVRVTVMAGGRRVDVSAPSTVPAGELLPDLTRIIGPPHGDPAHAHLRLQGPGGREMSALVGLRDQGVVDGDVLHLSTDVECAAGTTHDDIVEVVAESIAARGRSWTTAWSARMTLAGGTVLLLLAAAALVRVGAANPPATAALAGVVATVLISAAIGLSRGRADHLAGAVAGWLGSGYAATAGLVAGGGEPLLGRPLILAGLGGALAGLTGAWGLAKHRALMVPPVALAVLAIVGGLLLPTMGSPAEVLATIMTLSVIGGSLLAWLALSLSGIVPQTPLRAGRSADPRPLNPRQISIDVGRSDQLLLAMQGSVGLILVILVPVAVSLGVAGAVLAMSCCAVVALRARQHIGGAHVLVGVASGLLGLGVVAVSASVFHPPWTPVVTGALLIGGLGGLGTLLLPAGPTVRRRWLGDLLEALALVSLLPLLATATGLLDAVQG